MPRPITKSISQKYRPKIKTVMITTTVVACTSFSEGVVTFFISVRTSLLKDLIFSGQEATRPPRLSPGSAAAIDFVIFFVSIPMRHTCFLLLPKTGRGGGIRTPKSGFGDRQFNR